MFNRYNADYLETRSTNPPKVVEGLGTKVLAADEYKDDLYPELV